MIQALELGMHDIGNLSAARSHDHALVASAGLGPEEAHAEELGRRA